MYANLCRHMHDASSAFLCPVNHTGLPISLFVQLGLVAGPFNRDAVAADDCR
jgi:hypothetical protein